MIIVDSNVWIDYFKDVRSEESDRLDRYFSSHLVGLGDVILTEVLQGFRSDRDFERAKAALLSLTVLPMMGVDMAITRAENFRTLRTRGVTVRKTVDLIIATFCIEHGHQLLFSDRDFEPFVRHLGLTPA